MTLKNYTNMNCKLATDIITWLLAMRTPPRIRQMWSLRVVLSDSDTGGFSYVTVEGDLEVCVFAPGVARPGKSWYDRKALFFTVCCFATALNTKVEGQQKSPLEIMRAPEGKLFMRQAAKLGRAWGCPACV